ncbi:MAG: Protein of unknown function (DUF1553)/Planctomycete cytochrome C [Verrucomicrobia bacterium]|nr:MAG: Protein of unknown function (DUF1553)/Planctomycete cytochrome C [Verrucomicrobiota bacterium]
MNPALSLLCLLAVGCFALAQAPAPNDALTDLSAEPAPKEKTVEPAIVTVPDSSPARLPEGKVLVELCENGLPDKNAWPKGSPTASENYFAEAFGFSALPHRYADTGIRADRANPLFFRASARIRLPAGSHRLLLRARGASCLFIDGTPVLTTPFPKGGSDNAPLSAQNNFLDLGPTFRFAPPGNRESWCTFEATGAEHVVVLETLVGYHVGKTKRRPELGETVAAISLEGSEEWSLLSPGRLPLAYTDAGWDSYQKRTDQELAALNADNRAKARADHYEYWQHRRELAAQWIASTPEQEVPPLPAGVPVFNAIDHFIGAKLAGFTQQTAQTQAGAVDFFAEVQPLLEAHCMDCHKGTKSKGGLHLDRRSSALEGGESGKPALVPAEPQRSEILARVQSEDPDEVMPPKGTKLSPKEIATLQKWIQEGAQWPEFRPVPTTLTPLTSDLAFLRRVTLDTVGVVPSAQEIAAFVNDSTPERRARVIDRLLADPRSADQAVGYWQDVLAENPNILNPTLNNTGPFRWWIHESLLDHKPADLMVTELVRLRGSERFGGPAGFGVASQNDVPMAAKGTILGAAFLGVEMKCARCHDAPAHRFKQEQLFQLSAMLGQKSIKVPTTSSVPADKLHAGGRKALIEVTLKPGAIVAPDWPFPEFVPGEVADWLAEDSSNPADRLAALLTAPQNERFAQVLVNRFWARLMGRGIVEPVADWENAVPTHPELLRWLGRELVRSGYDATHVIRLILNSHAYQRATDPTQREPNPLYTAPAPRRLQAEQVVDSLFAATGKPFHTEEASLDIDSNRDLGNSLSLGYPSRAWMLTSTSNERDRPSLSLPRIQAVADVLAAFGWRASRQDPASVRDQAANVLQPAILSNGVMGTWLTILSEDHGVTALACEPLSLEQFLDALFLRILTRHPNPSEKERYTALLAPEFATRLQVAAVPPKTEAAPRRPAYYVSWSNHLAPEATRIRMQQEVAARKGDPPTSRLVPQWRERLEDVLWALLNSPEFIFTP